MEGLILLTNPSGDKDIFAKVLSREYGKIAVFAKRNRASRRQSATLLETLDHGTFDIKQGKGDIFYLRTFRPISSFPEIRTSLSKLSIAYFLLEVVDTVLPECTGDDDGLFDLICSSLHAISTSTSESNDLKMCCNSLARVLVQTGFQQSIEATASMHTLKRLIAKIESINERPLRSRRALDETLERFAQRRAQTG